MLFRMLSLWKSKPISKFGIQLLNRYRLSNANNPVKTGHSDDVKVFKSKRAKFLLVFVGSGLFFLGIMSVTYFPQNIFSRTFKPLVALCNILVIYAILSRMTFDSENEYEIELSKKHTKAAEVLCKLCVDLGGLYVKMGQAMTNMNYILPQEYILVLNSLKKITKTDSFFKVVPSLESTAGSRYLDLFDNISPVSYASASIGVLFRAQIKHEQDEVIMKFKTRAIKEFFYSDLKMAKFFFTVLSKFIPHVKFSFVVEKIEHTLAKELDFINEACNAKKCKKDLERFPFVYIPKVYDLFTTRDLLIMEYIQGTEPQVHCFANDKYDPKDFLSKIFDVFGYQIFVTGFVHADPHHANLLARRKNDMSTELCILDHGLYADLQTADRIAFANFFLAGVLGDIDKIKEYANLLGVKDYEILWTIIFQRPFSNTGYNYSRMSKDEFQKKLKIMTKDKVYRISEVLSEIPSDLLLVIRNISTLIAMNRSFGEPVDIYEYFVKWAYDTAYNQSRQLSLFQRIIKFFYSLYIKFCLKKHQFLRSALRKIAEDNSLDIQSIEL